MRDAHRARYELLHPNLGIWDLEEPTGSLQD